MSLNWYEKQIVRANWRQGFVMTLIHLYIGKNDPKLLSYLSEIIYVFGKATFHRKKELNTISQFVLNFINTDREIPSEQKQRIIPLVQILMSDLKTLNLDEVQKHHQDFKRFNSLNPMK